MRISLTLQGQHPPDRLAAMAATAEEAGLWGLWLTDSSLHSRDCYALLGALAVQTEHLRLGTAVTHPRTRHPAIATIAMATVDELSGGRAVLGVGAGDRPVRELGERPAKVDEVREMIGLCRALLTGERIDRDAPFPVHGHLRVPARPDLPIWVAASGPRMLALAGELADGVLALVGTCAPCVDYALTQVGGAAAAAGRPAPEVAVMGYGVIDDDEEVAWRGSRSLAAWFAQTAPHYCALAGVDPELVARIRAAYTGGEFSEATAAAELVPREMVRLLTLGGTPDEVADRLADLAALGVRHLNYFPIGAHRDRSLAAFCDLAAARPVARAAGR